MAEGSNAFSLAVLHELNAQFVLLKCFCVLDLKYQDNRQRGVRHRKCRNDQAVPLATEHVHFAVWGSLSAICEHPSRQFHVVHCNTVTALDVDLLDPDDPFEVDEQLAHLFKHSKLGLDDVYDVWQDDPLFYPAPAPPADWLMVGEVPGDVLVVPLMKPRTSDQKKARPIGVYRAPTWLDRQYRDDRR
jgi:hypothetical protein